MKKQKPLTSQAENVDKRYTTRELKNSKESFNDRLEHTVERISKKQHRSFKVCELE